MAGKKHKVFNATLRDSNPYQKKQEWDQTRRMQRIGPSGENMQEDRMIGLLDELDMFNALRPQIREALRAKDTKLALEKAEIHAMLRVIETAMTAQSPRLRYEAAKEILYMRGYKPVDKQAVLGINTDDMTSDELSARILSLLKDGESANETIANTEIIEEPTREASRTPAKKRES